MTLPFMLRNIVCSQALSNIYLENAQSMRASATGRVFLSSVRQSCIKVVRILISLAFLPTSAELQ